MAGLRMRIRGPMQVADTQTAVVTTAPPPAPNPSLARIQGAPGWRPLPNTAAPWQQVGAYGGTLLNQYPAMLPGVQLYNGVSGLYPGWYVPPATPLPNTAVVGLQTGQKNAYLPGAQRWGSRFTGPIGPLSVKQMQANIVAAQVRQSGLSALQWARGLSE